MTIIGLKNSTELETFVTASNTYAGVEFPDNWKVYLLWIFLNDLFVFKIAFFFIQYKEILILPDVLNFSLRFPSELRARPSNVPLEVFNWFTEQMYPTFQENGPRNPNFTDGGTPPGYNTEGFLPLQQAISRAFLLEKGFGYENSTSQNVYLQRFPHPPYVADTLLTALELVLPLIIIISLLSSVVNIVRVSNSWVSNFEKKKY